LTLGIFAENVFDTTYKAYTLDLGNLGETSYYAPPRTYGANVKYAW
jgi:iron complex outermembrane receptor protein